MPGRFLSVFVCVTRVCVLSKPSVSGRYPRRGHPSYDYTSTSVCFSEVPERGPAVYITRDQRLLPDWGSGEGSRGHRMPVLCELHV